MPLVAFLSMIDPSLMGYAQIEKTFGYKVAKLVEECTDDKNLPKEERKRRQILSAPHKSFEVGISRPSLVPDPY
jgi:(p)ppGpp synthase/HD superfamily hydrolase